MVRRLAEKKAREFGYREITEEILDQFKGQMMGTMGGEGGMAEAADQMAKGQLPWTAAAKERLAAVPEFMRGMIKQIADEIARKGGHMEVNVDLFEKVEALGDDPRAGVAARWNGPKARWRCLQQKIKESPPIAMDFVSDMIRHDTEELAREKGLTQD